MDAIPMLIHWEANDYEAAKDSISIHAMLRKARPDIPILLCTGFQDKDIEDKIQKAGIAGYLMKPLNRQEIAVAVRKLLDKKIP